MPSVFHRQAEVRRHRRARRALQQEIERADQSGRYVQRVWVSPSGRTSYGVIHFTMPLPLGQGVALAGFLGEMKGSEGDAHLISRQATDKGLAFLAEGGRYRVDGIIL